MSPANEGNMFDSSILKRTLTMVLAGGQGERLYPLTKDRAKPAVPFGGIYKLIDFTLSNCMNSGIRKINVLTQYNSVSLDRHLKLGWNIFSRELGEFIDTIPPQQRTSDQWYQGTADAIYQNIYILNRDRPDQVLILSGDHIYKMNYQKMLEFHITKGADLTIAGVEVDKEKARQLGVIQSDADGCIVGFEEKPQRPKTLPHNPSKALVSMGVYIFQTDKLVKAVIEDAKKDTEHDFGKNVIPKMISKAKVYVYNFKDQNKGRPEYWRDIGLIDTYWEANMDLVEVTPLFNLYDETWPIRTYQQQHPPAKTVFAEEGRMGVVLSSLISGGSIISGGRVERSVLSPRVRVNSYSEVSESVLMQGVNVGRYARIKRAIIDEGVSIPPGFQIGYDPEEDATRFTVTDYGIVVVPRGIRLDDEVS